MSSPLVTRLLATANLIAGVITGEWGVMSKKKRVVLGVACAVLVTGLIAGAAWWFISGAPMSEDDFDDQASDIVESLDRAIIDISEAVQTDNETKSAPTDLADAVEALADAADEGTDAAEELRAPDSRDDSAEDLESALDEYGDISDDLLDICDEADDPSELRDAIATYLEESAAKLKKVDRVMKSLADDVDYEPKSEGLYAALSPTSMPPQLSEDDLTSDELPQGHPSAGGNGSDAASALTEEQMSAGSLPSGHPAIGGATSSSDPRYTVEQFLAAEASGDWQTAWDILPKSVKSMYGTMESFSTQLKGYGDLSNYEIVSSTTNGDTATVVSAINIGGMEFRHEWKLRREGSDWVATDRTMGGPE